MTLLVRRDGDHGTDTALAQVIADGAGGAHLVGKDHVGPGAGPFTAAGDAQACHDIGEGGRVAGLAGGETEGQGPAAVVGGKVDLRGQSAVGPADGDSSRPPFGSAVGVVRTVAKPRIG